MELWNITDPLSTYAVLSWYIYVDVPAFWLCSHAARNYILLIQVVSFSAIAFSSVTTMFVVAQKLQEQMNDKICLLL